MFFTDSLAWNADMAAGYIIYGQTIGNPQIEAKFRVSETPIPASIWLFTSGLLGLLGFMKRKSHV